jgi:hypothetical protein
MPSSCSVSLANIFLNTSSWLAIVYVLTLISSLVIASGGYFRHDHIIKGFFWNIFTNSPMLTPNHVVFHDPPNNQVKSYLLHVIKSPKIFIISAWAKYMLLISWITFNISFGNMTKVLTLINYRVSRYVRSYTNPCSIYLYTKN